MLEEKNHKSTFSIFQKAFLWRFHLHTLQIGQNRGYPQQLMRTAQEFHFSVVFQNLRAKSSSGWRIFKYYTSYQVILSHGLLVKSIELSVQLKLPVVQNLEQSPAGGNSRSQPAWVMFKRSLHAGFSHPSL